MTTTVCEDTVYVNYFSLSLALPEQSDTSAWEDLCVIINETIQTLTSNYLWHKDDLKVYLPLTDKENDVPTHLKSTTCFGDNIEDEWFVVYVILRISAIYEELIIQITDNDGEFLLIEAANYLPSWANPESTENRVFIYKGHVHIIPPALKDLNTNMCTKEAISLVAQLPDQTKASQEIEDAIVTRISKYPQKIYENFHNAVVKLPLELAALLKMKPSFISAIVDSYCNHDIFDVKCCQNFEYVEPICVKVKFTKCLFAMLLHSKLMRVKEQKLAEGDKKTILGLKLTYGFKMLMNRLTKDIFSTKEYIRFFKKLSEIGYFQGNIQDSKEYNRLLEKAKQYFLNTECPLNTCVSKNISEVMSSSDFKNVKDSLTNSDFNEEDLYDDSDEWLNIDPNQLNDLLNNHYDNKIKFRKDDDMTPDVITSKLSNFLKQTSDYEGIDTRDSKELGSESIEFDTDEFVNCLEKMLNVLSSKSDSKNHCDESESEIESDNSDEACEIDKELASQANLNPSNTKDSKGIVLNIMQSIKEEGLCGPSTNLLKSVGVRKSDMLDSDDDC